MNPVRPFVLRPVATLLLALGVLVFGLAAWWMLPVAALPEIEYPVISVTANLPGASPETMATAVAAPLERQFAWLTDVESIDSFSSLGTTYLRVRFGLDRNIDMAAADVQSAISNAGGDLPKDMPVPPYYYKENPADRAMVVIAFTSPVMTLTKIDQYVDTMVVRRIGNQPGVSRAFLADEQKKAIRIQMNPGALAARSLSPEDIRIAIGRATANRPKGSLEGGESTATVQSNDQLFDADAVKSIVVAWRNGAPVRLAEVAEVVDGVENDRMGGWYNGIPAIIVGIQKRAGANTVAAVDGIKRSLDRIKGALPPSIDLHYVTDRAETIRTSLHDVEWTMAVTIGLVILVIFLFLRSLWATVIPSITIPLSLLATFTAMAVFGFTLDNLSLMALTISVGFVVDDAIVMIENIVRHIEAGKDPLTAAIEGGGQVAMTIISITLSLVAVFIPVFLMGGVVGRIFREFGVTVSAAILASACISLTLSPMLCGRLMRARHGAIVGGEKQGRPPTARARLEGAAALVYDRVFDSYRRSLDWVLGHQTITMVGLLVTAALTVTLYVVIPKGFFPPQDNGRIYGFAVSAADTPFKTSVALVQRLSTVIRSDPDIFSATSYVGSDGGENTGSFVINLKPRSQRHSDVAEVMARLRIASKQVSGMQLFMQPEAEISTGTDFGRSEYIYQLIDPDRTELESWLPKIEARMKDIPGLLDVSREQQTGVPSARVVVNREVAARLGIDSQAVDDTLYDAFGARHVAEIFTDVSQYYAILEVAPKFQADPHALELIHVASHDGTQVPLSTFAHIETATEDSTVTHHGQFPAERISFNLARSVSIGEAVDRIHAMERQIGKPIALQTSFEGNAKEFVDSLASEPWLIAAAVLVVYIVLGVLYESFIHPLTILSTLPSAGVGALLALIVCRQNLDVMGLIGIILLIGIVKKNAIMMVDFAVKAERDGASPLAAIREACLVRFRPITMTTVAALFGALPLALGGGAGSELRHPLGIAIVGGLMLSQVLTLYTTPVIHLRLGALAGRLRRFRLARLAPASADPQGG